MHPAELVAGLYTVLCLCNAVNVDNIVIAV